MQRVNEHCCDSRGVKPDIRHPDLTCLPIHHRLSFLSVLLLPLIPPPLLLDSPALSSPHLAPLPFHDHPSLSGIALRGRELCGWNMAAAPRAHASGTPVTSRFSPPPFLYIFIRRGGDRLGKFNTLPSWTFTADMSYLLSFSFVQFVSVASEVPFFLKSLLRYRFQLAIVLQISFGKLELEFYLLVMLHQRFTVLIIFPRTPTYPKR